jgi:hypothetical protein
LGAIKLKPTTNSLKVRRHVQVVCNFYNFKKPVKKYLPNFYGLWSETIELIKSMRPILVQTQTLANLDPNFIARI